MSYKVQLLRVDGSRWVDNDFRFRTAEEAQASAAELRRLHPYVGPIQIVECVDTVNAYVLAGRAAWMQ